MNREQQIKYLSGINKELGKIEASEISTKTAFKLAGIMTSIQCTIDELKANESNVEELTFLGSKNIVHFTPLEERLLKIIESIK